MSYTLIISEKPSASQRIATALAEGPVEKLSNNGVAYYRIHRGKKEIIVAPAVGHLFILSEKKASRVWTYPVFSVEWKQTYLHRGSHWAKKYFENLALLSKKAREFISATDYDVEGSVIAYNILRYIAGVKDAKRMKFSTLTKTDLVEAYEKASNHLDFHMIEAGLTRHTMDFLWGINTSRALTLSLRHAGGFKILSTGRVQGPTLKILEEREEEIAAFKSMPFWEIELTGTINGESITAAHKTDKFWKKPEAEKVLKNTKSHNGTVENIEKKQHIQNPPFPFDLTTLQREAYSLFGFQPKQALDILQLLYERALISYPRTSSQKLPAKIGYKTILSALAKQKNYHTLCGELLKKTVLKPNEGKKIDPAHPSIFPTGTQPKKLSSYQQKLYDLIVKRFLSVFGDPALRESDTVTLDVNDEKFILQGMRTLKANWIDFYRPYARFKEQLLPKMKVGDAVTVKKIELFDKETQPPKRFTPASILKEMEQLGLGTKATRSHILHTLYERDYIKENSIEVTELGKSVVNALEKYCAEVVSPHLTKEFEQDMEAIVEGKKKRKEIVENAEKVLEPIFQKFKSNELRIGKELLEGFKEALREESLVGKCTCGGDLLIRMSHKGKRFVGCSKYPKCTQTFSLPQHGYISITHKTCEKCGLNILSVKSRGKWPWKLCIRDGFVIKRKPKAGASRKQAAKPAPKAGAKPTAKTVTKTKKQVTRTKR